MTALEQKGYSNGYAAGQRRIGKLKAEITRLRQLKDPPESHDTTVEYLLKVSETFTQAAEMMIGMRANNPKKVDSKVDSGESEALSKEAQTVVGVVPEAGIEPATKGL